MNKILSKNIDKKTEILTKYKLAKYKCVIKEYNDAIEIINELINNQYFEPVALSVANPEFKEIRNLILDLIQGKLEDVKKIFYNEEVVKINKINSLDINLEFKLELLKLIDTSSFAIKESSNFLIILTSSFKESYNEFLQNLELLGELKQKTEKELDLSIRDLIRFRKISELNEKIDITYSKNSNVSEMSHRILLSKLKLNVKLGIDEKVIILNSTEKFYQNADTILNSRLNLLLSIANYEIIKYINSDFSLSEFSKGFLPIFTISEDNKAHSNKIIQEYYSIISRFNLKDKIDNYSSIVS
jgi:hypothetical protein